MNKQYKPSSVMSLTKLTNAKLCTKRAVCSSAGKLLSSVSSGLPLAQGIFTEDMDLVVAQGESVLPSHTSILTRWSDGSAKWVLLDIDLSASNANDTDENGNTDISIYTTAEPQNLTSETSFKNQDKNFSLSNSKLQLMGTLGANSSKLFDQILSVSGYELCSALSIQAAGETGVLSVDDLQVEECEHSNALRRAILLSGHLLTSQGERSLNFSLRLDLYAAQSAIFGAFEVHNPNAAGHPDGMWDLGDPGSVYLYELTLKLSLGDIQSLEYKLDEDSAWQSESTSMVSIIQASSGNENWNSANHLTRRGKVELPYSGYRVRNQHETVAEGQKAQPTLRCKSTHAFVEASIEDFWQNFPSALGADQGSIHLGLFPSDVAQEFELQAGEKKTQRFALRFSDAPNAPGASPISLCEVPVEVGHLQLPREYWSATGALPFMARQSSFSALSDLIKSGLEGESDFFTKRNQIDEYGWRNFGDIYADHELLEYSGDTIISHYNNQYDPLYGFIRQYLNTGDTRWWELADDLAKHVLDIDIYHTELDRAEYNHGLFWHTDHYVDASTSTHRTYSKDQAGQYEFAGLGGGPAGQHCYTAGLTYYYFLSGDQRVKQAVLGMTQWITRYYEGAGTLFDFLLAIKNRNVIDFKHPLSTGHHYPLDRGVGHYLNALMDASSMTGESAYLVRADQVIRGTVHPRDPVDQRGLLNAEAFWFYIVFLQSVARFLTEKEALGQIDSAFNYARASLLQYAFWMLEHEQPNLTNPEQLDFPNLTWAAQDLRKAVVFYQAYRFSPGLDERYLEKAKFFRDYAVQEIAADETKELARIQTILMQNQGVEDFIATSHSWNDYGPVDITSIGESPMVRPKSAFKVVIIELLKVLRVFNPIRELAWLRSRAGVFRRAKDRVSS